MFPFSDEDLQEPVSHIIKTKIAPAIASDGGNIVLLQIKDSKVYKIGRASCRERV